MMAWTMHRGWLRRAEQPASRDAPKREVLIAEFWPAPGQQWFSVRLTNGEEATHEKRDSLAAAIELAEEWLP